MIGIAGTRADPVMLHFATRCVVAGVPFADLDLMQAVSRGDWELTLPPGPGDWISGAEEVRLAELSGIYVRPIFLGTTARERMRWAGLLEGLNAWLDGNAGDGREPARRLPVQQLQAGSLRLVGGTRAEGASQPHELRPGADPGVPGRGADGRQTGLRRPGDDPRADGGRTRSAGRQRRSL